MSIAWVFPGQGSQKVGMADSVLSLPKARERFNLASDIFGRDLLAICQGSLENEDLNDTRNTQPALFVIESLLVDDLILQGRKPSFVAGHSLGEISALYSANVFNVKTALELLKSRSELMSTADNGAMTAVIGFDRQELQNLVDSTKDIVVANDNSSNQVVLSGSPEAVNYVSNQLTCKRAIPLNVSGAFHSPFMEDAAKEFSQKLDMADFKDSLYPVISNSDPTPSQDNLVLKKRLKAQMTSGVRWRETIDCLANKGVNTFVEVGPGNVLSGLIKRSLPKVTITQISSSIDLGH
tara:strand:+ start:129 stop:1013 length:885 start_codon:yes stop_codon:yes gene_type:complete